MNIKRHTISLLTAMFTLVLVCSPGTALNAAENAYKICENTVIPALFPFFVCSNLLTAFNVSEYLNRIFRPIMRPLFGVGENASLAVIMGIVSGYPVGAKTAAALKDKGLITKSEGDKLLSFCNNSGPLFILGAVGSGMLFDRNAGAVLYAAHISAAVSSALLMRNVKCSIAVSGKNKTCIVPDFGAALTDSISVSMNTVYTISGFVIISAIFLKFTEMSGITELISLAGIDKEYVKCALYGFIEPTNGCIEAAKLKISLMHKCMIISAIIGWSGVSVHLQVLGIIRKSGLSIRYYFLGKLISAVLSPFFTAVIFNICPNINIGFSSIPAAPFESTSVYIALFTGILILFSVLYRILKKE